MIEAGTGEGKTEAALLAAEVLAHRFGCGGVMFALPTQATSNGAFPRVRDWIERLPDVGRTSMFLAHGNSGLNDDFQGIVDAGRLASIDDEFDKGSIAVATSWLRGRRKGLLANFVVGTIDQVLLGALRARHLPLRQLALGGKVVIIDEAHAADPYMRTYGRGIMWWLGAFGTPVILLSATLPPGIRAEWLQAYAEGSAPDADRDEADPTSIINIKVDDADLSPRVTMLDDQLRNIPVIQGGHATRSLHVEIAGFDADAADATVLDAVADGAVVAVVANTVDRAQKAYDRLTSALGPDRVELFHSRFLANHRAEREELLRHRLGPPGPETLRPHGLVVVATQVIEQSLDVDFDLMVTDLAPIDLLIQRAGRLHRHVRGEEERERPASVREPRLLLIGVREHFDAAPTIDRSVGAVYHDRDLLDALDVLVPHLNGKPLRTPTDVPRLVRTAYDRTRPMPPEWSDAVGTATSAMLAAINEQRNKAGAFLTPWPTSVSSLQDYLAHGRGADSEEEGSAQVRDGDESLEVIVVRRDGHVVKPMPGCGLDDVVLPTEYGAPDNQVARVLATCKLRLPRLRSGKSQYVAIDKAITELEQRNADLAGWQSSRWLKGALVLDLDSDLRTDLVGRTYHYDVNRGLVRESKEQ